jgi:hypothetical protein
LRFFSSSVKVKLAFSNSSSKRDESIKGSKTTHCHCCCLPLGSYIKQEGGKRQKKKEKKKNDFFLHFFVYFVINLATRTIANFLG